MSVQNVKSKSIIIGLTGGIASGKSTAADCFKKLNIPVIDSDQIVSTLWSNHQIMIQEVESLFGFLIRTEEDKKKLGEIIFNDQKKREQLNQIVHPYVFLAIEDNKQRYLKHRVIVIDMPLLIEVGYQIYCDYVVVVYTHKKNQLKRLMERDQLTQEQAMTRINAQLDLDEKVKMADIILDNNQSKTNLYEQIDSFLRSIGYEE